VTSAFPLHRYTYEEYVWLEAESTTRHEFLDGEIVAMAGGTPEHAAMGAEVIRQLGDQLRDGPCRVFTSDLGVRVLATGLATYPDASVVCGPTQRDTEKKTTVTNPRVLVEVTSNGTEDYDRGEKLEHYKQIPTLEAVVIVSHREPRIEVWSRSATSNEWSRSEARAGDTAVIPPLGCTLDVDSVWRAAAEPA
jgi:Uma2 family endonuclease